MEKSEGNDVEEDPGRDRVMQSGTDPQSERAGHRGKDTEIETEGQREGQGDSCHTLWRLEDFFQAPHYPI